MQVLSAKAYICSMITSRFHRIFIIIVMLLIAAAGHSQQLQFERFTTADGVPSDRVYWLQIDRQGYIRACTDYGMARYNGSTFISICENIPFSDQTGYCMFEDKKGTMWFANARANIFRMRNDSAFKIRGIEQVSAYLKTHVSEINQLIVDDSENIWISTKSRSFKLSPQKGGYIVTDLSEYYRKENVSFVLVQNGNSYISVRTFPGNKTTSATACSYKIIGKSGTSNVRQLNNKDGFPRYVVPSGSSLYIPLQNELNKARADGSVQTISFQHFILAVRIDKKGHTWTGVDQEGLYELDSAGKVLNHYFPGTSVNHILFDDQDGLWVSTAGEGIYHCRNINDYAYLNYPGLMQPVSIAKQIDSSVFIGTVAGNIFKVNANGVEQIDLKGQVHTIITSILKTGDDYYISSKDAILRTDRFFRDYKRILTAEGKNAWAVSIETNSKGEVYTITRTGICKIENDTCREVRRIPPRATELIGLDDNSFLVGTSKSLYIFRNDSIFTPDNLKYFGEAGITELKRSADGSTWICTIGDGLLMLQPDHKVSVYPKLPGNILQDVFFINDTTVGVCLNTGIYIDVATKKNGRADWHRMFGEECIAPVIWQGAMYIGANSGLYRYDLAEINNRKRSKLYFKQAVAGSTIYTGDSFRLPHDAEKIEFHVDLLDYTTRKQKLFYRLENNENEQGMADGTIVTLNKLPPGSYTLLIYAAVSPYYLKEKNITIHFTIEPAFWQTSWFILLAVLTALLLLLLLIFIINSRTKKKERQKAEVTRLLAEYKLTALKAQINPHFISNSLSAIQELILDDQSDKAAQYLARFSLLIRYVLKYSDKSIVKLSDELKVIDLNIELETLRFRDDFEIRKEIAEDIDPVRIDVPPLITQPFIENAIWHGLLPLKGKRKPKLLISVSKINEDVLICIEDNGVGRNPGKSSQSESQGTQLISNRLENINLMLGTKSAMLKVEDLYDSAGAAAGTKVSIIIPGKFNNNGYDED
ncbi:MAG: signal transduction histidine kinase, LytS [Bacteroidetes bacterium]|nr:signal transduction histidine kinase, LytS [Bacteroidota bacterium]